MALPVLDIPKGKGPFRFVLQYHDRGRSRHTDLRFEVNDHLIGFTLDDPGAVGAKPKLSNVPGMHGKKILAHLKARQPKTWLTLEGEIKPGEPGATKYLPARFTIIDKGNYEMGAQKAAFLEAFLHGKVYQGRFLARKLPRQPKYAKAGKTPFVWFFWKAKDQTPHVLSSRARREDWVPPKGISALPDAWESKIPKELRWWEKGLTGLKADAMIEDVRKFLLKRKIITLTESRFVLQHHHWRGQVVIRGLPVQHWDLRLGLNKPYFNLDANPLVETEGINAVRKILTDVKWMTFEGEIPPGQPGNPNKKIPAYIKILDSGKVDIIESTPNFMSFKFYGSKLKGYWIMKKDGTWVFSKGELPKATKSSVQNIPISEEQIKEIKLLRDSDSSLSELARKVGCSKSTIRRQLRKLSVTI